MKRTILIFFAAVLACSASIAGTVENKWQKVDGSADGSWDDASHWAKGLPGAEHRAYFPGSLGSYTVTFPEGDVEIATSFRANVVEGETVTFEGLKSKFLQGTRETDTYSREPFGFNYRGNHFFNLQQYGDDAYLRHAYSEMTNFFVRLAGDGGPKLYFDKGSLNLYDPCSSAPWSAQMMIFSHNIPPGGDALPYEGVITFGKNTESRFGAVFLQGNNRTNILDFAGGNHVFMGTLDVPKPSQSMVNRETLTAIRVADDACVAFNGLVNFGGKNESYGNTANRIFKLQAENGGHIAVSNSVSQYEAGRLGLEAKNGAVMDFFKSVSLAGVPACTSAVTVAGATLKIGGDFSQGCKSGVGNSIFYATNSVVDIYSSGNFKQISSTLRLVDSTVSSKAYFLLSGNTRAEISGPNANSEFFNVARIGEESGSAASMEVSGGEHVFKGSIFVGSSGFGSLKLSGGVVRNLDAPGGNAFTYLGTYTGSKGEMQLAGGSFIMPGTEGIKIGYEGLGDLKVDGGSLEAAKIMLGTFDSPSQMEEDVFEQSGGTVKISRYDNNFGLRAAVFANRRARVSLTGGILRCGRFAAGAGTAEFYADGGMIEVPGANTEFFSGFSIAKLGPKGLEIRSDYDITAAQAFSSSVDGGRLVVSGSGVKTFSAAGTSLSEVEIMDGKAVFPSGIAALGRVKVTRGGRLAFAGNPPASAVSSLVLGDEESFGVLEVNAGLPIKVAGDVVVNAAKIVLNGDFASGAAETGCPIVEFTGEISEESRQRLAAALAEGLAAGDVAEFSVSEGSGSRAVTVKVRKRNDLTISLDAGFSSNATENVLFAYGETLAAVAGTEAILTMDGVYRYGRFAKEGPGKVVLVSGESRFLGGMLLAGGMLSLGDLNALVNDDPASAGAMVISNGTLEIVAPKEGLRLSKPLQLEAAPTNTLLNSVWYNGRDAVVIKNEVPLTMPVPSPAKAAFIKRGRAQMVIEADADVSFPEELGHDIFGYVPDNGTITEYVFDDYGNVPANFLYPALTVVDGELKLKGVGERPAQFDIRGSLMLSLPTKSVTEQPSLVLDNARLVNKGNGTRAYLGWHNNHSNSKVDCVTLSLTNNSEFSADTVYVNYHASAGAKARIDAYASKFIATYQLHAGYGNESDIVYSFSNASQLLAARFDIYASSVFDFDSSLFAKNAQLNPVAMTMAKNTGYFFNFRNGSEFFCDSITTTLKDGEKNALKVELLFENSKWIPGAGDHDFTAAAAAGACVKVEGSGLVLEPPAGKTWTMGLPVSGDGGMVIGGSGKVVLDGSKWEAHGAVKIREGATLDLGGTAAEGLFVAGGGTLENGTVSGGVAVSVKADGTAVEEGLPLLRDVSFSGPVRVKLDFADGVLRPPYRTVAVARYEGAAPDAGSWRLVKNSADRALGAKFSAANGKVYMTPGKYGTVLVVR